MARKGNKVEVIERGLGREKCDGLAWIGENLIEIDKNLVGKDRLGVILHEIGHLAFPNASETQILKFEKMARDTLWDLGYRHVEL